MPATDTEALTVEGRKEGRNLSGFGSQENWSYKIKGHQYLNGLTQKSG